MDNFDHNYSDSPLISVIVPCFNSGKHKKNDIFYKKANLEKKEIILVNDGSTDQLTINILREIGDEKIVKLINQKNNGLARLEIRV